MQLLFEHFDTATLRVTRELLTELQTKGISKRTENIAALETSNQGGYNSPTSWQPNKSFARRHGNSEDVMSIIAISFCNMEVHTSATITSFLINEVDVEH